MRHYNIIICNFCQEVVMFQNPFCLIIPISYSFVYFVLAWNNSIHYSSAKYLNVLQVRSNVWNWNQDMSVSNTKNENKTFSNIKFQVEVLKKSHSLHNKINFSTNYVSQFIFSCAEDLLRPHCINVCFGFGPQIKPSSFDFLQAWQSLTPSSYDLLKHVPQFA